MHNHSCGKECYFLPEIHTAIAWISLSVQDIFCCILNTLFKSKIWAKIDELVQERDHTKQYSSSCEKKRRKKQGDIDSLFFYLVTPSFPAKKSNRTLSLWGTVVDCSGAVLWNSLPRTPAPYYPLPYIRTWDIVKKINDHSGQCYMTTSIIQSHKLDRTILAMGH